MEDLAGFLLGGLDRVIPAKAGIQNFTAIRQNRTAACAGMASGAIRLNCYERTLSPLGLVLTHIFRMEDRGKDGGPLGRGRGEGRP